MASSVHIRSFFFFSVRTCVFFLMLSYLFPFSENLNAQSLNGKIIYVSDNQEVMLKFPAVITNYYTVPKKELIKDFETRITNDKNFSITSNVANFKTKN